jgi:cytoskeletal protein RodZ
MLRVLVYGLLWILLMGVAIFATQNTLLVTIKFLTFESINLPLGLVLVFSGGLGAIAATVWQNMSANEAEAIADSPNATKQPSSYSAYRASRSTEESSQSSKSAAPTSSSASTKNTAKNDKFNDFDEEWDNDWG